MAIATVTLFLALAFSSFYICKMKRAMKRERTEMTGLLSIGEEQSDDQNYVELPNEDSNDEEE